MREIGIIKLSQTWTPEYSVNSVVKNQIRTLLSKGFRVRVLLEKGSTPWLFEDQVEYLPVLPVLRFKQEPAESELVFQEKVSKMQKGLVENLQGLDMVFCHDLIYLGSYIYHNIALRQCVASFEKTTWVHWTHSETASDDMPCHKPGKERGFPHSKRYEGMPNSIYVSLSAFNKKNIAQRYQVSEDKVFVVHNTRLNEDYLGFDSLSIKIIKKLKLFEADVVSVLPTNLNRLSKQPEISLYIMAALKALGKKVRLVIANTNSKNHKSKETPNETHRILNFLWLSKKLGLTQEEVVLTSDVDPMLSNHVPERVIRDLQSISDIYIHASFGETFSLAVFEAALFRNVCVLNEEVEVFHELFGDNVVWIKAGKLWQEIVREFKLEGNLDAVEKYLYYYKYYQMHESYYRDCAERILKELNSSKAASLFSQLKKEFNNESIFEKQLAPILTYNHKA